MTTGNIWKRRTVRTPCCQSVSACDAVARSAAVSRSGLDVASPAIRWRTDGNGIHTNCAAIRMTTVDVDVATGERGRPGCRCVYRTGIREGMRYYSARDVDCAVYVLRWIVKAGVGCIDVCVTVFTDGARRETGMRGVRRWETV